jgi:hypothetical protein
MHNNPAMQDLQKPASMWLKAALFLVIGGVCAGLLWSETPTLKSALLLGLLIWSFCRAYYFAFYVLEHYADPNFKYAGLFSLLQYILRKPRP